MRVLLAQLKKKKKKKKVISASLKKKKKKKKILLFKFSSQVFCTADIFFSFLYSFYSLAFKKKKKNLIFKKKKKKLCGRLTVLFFVLAGQRTSVNGARGASTAAGWLEAGRKLRCRCCTEEWSRNTLAARSARP